ncbi:hypothetical protein SNE40_002365 [Patella caerulea]|uniref:PAN2-PAN3 deadenylation complex catalytic subunit PAN2 n=1 Tax=Patella caerulea TaxID=87958 RepID=A0AAN8K0Z2_PATCE
MDFRGVPSTFTVDGIPPMPAEMLQERIMDPNMMPNDFHGNQMYHPGNQPESEFNEVQSVWMDGVGRYPITCLSFDTQELLWAGNQGGYAASYGGLNLQKYSAFRSHVTDEIRQILTTEQGILSLTRNALRCSVRRGLSVFTYSDPIMQDMQCMLRTSPTSLLIGGHQKKAIEIDLNKVQIVQEFDTNDAGCAILRQSGKYLCVGDTSGKVTLYDSKSMKGEQVLDAHTGTLSDFDVQGNLIVTCGFANRMGAMTADRFLKVYDMRVMRAVAPIQIPIDPMFVRFVSAYSNRLAVVSQSGSFQVIETTAMTPPNMMLYHVNSHGAAITSFDISQSCQALAFGDSSSYIHLFSTGDHACFNFEPEAIEFADPVDHIDFIHIMDERTPYSLIPMIYPTNGHLISDWPMHLAQKIYRKPKAIDPEILRVMKVYNNHNAGYAQNPGKERRNQVPYKLSKNKKSNKSSVPESPLGRGEEAFVLIPRTYKKLEMKYSKLGLADFDFRHYNKTKFAGLETHIPNAYCNAMLQVLYFIEPLRCALISHLCQKEFCLACELGFLFHMLDCQAGQTCQASNFLRAFRTIPEVAALGLVLSEADESAGRANLSRLIQSWQRFVHQQIHSETCYRVEPITPEEEQQPQAQAQTNSPPQVEKKEEKPAASSKSRKKRKKGKKKEELKEKEKEESDAAESNGDETATATSKTSEESVGSETADENTQPKKVEEKSIITELFGMVTRTILTCRCGVETSRDVNTTLTNLSYPDITPAGPNEPPKSYSMSDVLKYSWMSENVMQAWCNECHKYQPHTQKKVLQNVPDVIALNCQMENKRDFQFWKTQIKLLSPDQDGEKEGAPHEPVRATVNKTRCRYGRACFRKDCKFRHPETDDPMEDWLDQLEQEENQVSWIPLGLKIKLENSNLDIAQITDEETLPKKIDQFTKYYELLAIVSLIKDETTGGNLVSHIKVGEPYHMRKERVPCTQWYHINDFCIEPVERPEVTQMNLDWKIPCVLYFIRRNITDFHECKVVNPITADVLLNDHGLVNPKRRKITFSPLQPDELPKKGDLIGLDAEFISLKEEEAELRSDGTKSTIKPSHMSVARITCIHGQGPSQSTPFIDDHITNLEQVVDYLTQYSGIKPGDLDPNFSTKHLTTLKSTYQKLRYLIDAGVIFIGHGLKKDFRVINILVPKDQVIDTVELFHLPRQRMISLKFLASYYLKLNIQSFTHDSVEDARTALRLYLKYKELDDESKEKVQASIKEMYEVGRKTQWKIPDIEEDSVDTAVALL